MNRENIEELIEEIREVDTVLSSIKSKLYAALQKTHRDAIKASGLKFEGDMANLEFGHHECVDSPTNECIYEDGYFDECIVCGAPEERK